VSNHPFSSIALQDLVCSHFVTFLIIPIGGKFPTNQNWLCSGRQFRREHENQRAKKAGWSVSSSISSFDAA
jgi:hypothetical protein